MCANRKNDSGNNANLRFNGITDAYHAYTPGGHSSHDLGMAMDLGINDWVSQENQLFAGETVPAISVPAAPPGTPKWSVDRAIELSGGLNAADSGTAPDKRNNQRDMTRDFLSLYWATKEDLKVGEQWVITGGDNDADRLIIQSALFRAGNAERVPDPSKSLIDSVYIGAVSKIVKNKNGVKTTVLTNRYPQVNEVLKALGIKSSALAPHEHHFHLTFAPPGIQKIIKAPATLLADGGLNLQPPAEEETQSLQDVLLALSLPKADRVEKICQTYVTWDAMSNTLSPAWEAQMIMGGQAHKGESAKPWVDRLHKDWAVKRVSLVEPPLHGRYIELKEESAVGVDNDRGSRYLAPSKEFNGQDRLSFLVEFDNGKRILMRYQMNPGEPEDNSNDAYCHTNLLT